MAKREKPATDWREAATQLGTKIPRDRLHPAVLAWSASSSPSARWSVAFSGGADSLALLLLLWAHWPARRARLDVRHFNHRLRGRESQADEIFCRKVCAALHISFCAASWAGAHQGASEAEARSARLTFMAKNSRALWLGHQQDDIAETILMRLARGSGVSGLAAPRPVQSMPGRRVHLRPLLGLKKAEILEALREAGIPWREDSSNGEEKFFRNRVRKRVIAGWIKASQRDALAGASRSRELLEEDDRALEAWLDELQPVDGSGALLLARVAGRPRGLLRRALHRWLLSQPHAGELSRQAFDLLLAAVEKGKPTRQSLGSTGFAVIRGDKLRLEISGKP